MEGQTEEEFVNSLMSPYLKQFGINNSVPIPIETSPGFYGGDVRYSRYKNIATNLLRSDPNGIVTSLIDFYGLRNDFPGFIQSAQLQKNQRVEYIEGEIIKDIVHQNLIPYIQLHEFEALLFSDIIGFSNWFPRHINHFKYIINHFPNPEMINDNPESSPAARISKIVGGRKYKKTLHGPIIAMDIGMPTILQKCPRFNLWVKTIIQRASSKE
ncbi:DUF4276 family protein [Flavihumibacter sp. RY-1]|uniref:DUF4276 family protein n=1 Tax=Flavihumibacter fluminis TaxID=2909236 RepID=A0ABS9BN54_9BACT|nr:DUF4276 family protein [Flavihumibacter fluminis]